MVIKGVPPMFSAQIEYLLSHSPVNIKVEKMWSGSKDSAWLDRFTLLIPFCLGFVKWDIMFNVQNPLSSPDLIFGPEDDNFNSFILSDIELEGDQKNHPSYTLSNWNSRDPSSLFVLILQLRGMYSVYQRKLVEEVDDELVKFEIITISSREGLEMSLSPSAEKPEEVKFAVPLLLELNINAMVPAFPWKQQQKIFLQVIYPIRKHHSTRQAPSLKLVLTPDLKSLFAVKGVKLPPWTEKMCLVEYLVAVEETLKEQILEAISVLGNLGIRKRFIESLSAVFGNPLEADALLCNKATVRVAIGVFSFLVHISIPDQFPQQKPTLMLESSQKSSQGVPIQSLPSSACPWSPRWEPSEMASRLYNFVVEEASNFKKICNEEAIKHR